jgi:hypothetical protein
VSAVIVEPGQSWAIRDSRYDGWRYVTVEAIEDGRALVRPRHGRRSRISLNRFGRSRFTYCGHDGPERDLPPYTGPATACLNCGPKPKTLHLMTELEPGFGATVVTRDGVRVWDTCRETRKRVAHVECWARENPVADWRIRFVGPLSETVYQRQSNGWVLIWYGMGFA